MYFGLIMLSDFCLKPPNGKHDIKEPHIYIYILATFSDFTTFLTALKIAQIIAPEAL
jgi:hypothetical protein